MIEIRFHGRGGQGAVTSAELLAKAAGLDEKYSQAFPAFGPERRGAPVRAFCRIDDQPILTRAQIYNPDFVVVLDPTLAGLPDVADGLKPESRILINSAIRLSVCGRPAQSYDATCLAINTTGKPIVNTAMLGAFAAMTGLVSLESLKKAVAERFPGKVGESNVRMVEQSYNEFKGRKNDNHDIMKNAKSVCGARENSRHDGLDKTKKAVQQNGRHDGLDKQKQAVQPVNEAAVINQPGSSAQNKTGNWRTSTPAITDKCVACGICTWYCPEGCIKIAQKDGKKRAVIDYDYCKGCLICAKECPSKAVEAKTVCGGGK